MSEHTPGPWSVVAGDNYSIESEHIPHEYPHRFPSDDTGRFVAYVGNRQADFGHADAKLIAAAPELLKALQDILLFDSALSQENARAAIRKATEVSE